MDGAGGEEQASGRSYVRGRLYGLYSQVLHLSGFKSDGAMGTRSITLCASPAADNEHVVVTQRLCGYPDYWEDYFTVAAFLSSIL